MIELRIGKMESSRGHLYGIVTALSDGQVLFQDTVRLERADSRRQFSAEVVRIATDLGIEADQAAIEQKLLEILDREAQEAEAPAPGAEGLLTLLAGDKQATQLVKLADDAELFHTADKELYATIPVDGHRETWALDARPIKDWLSGRYYRKNQAAPNANALRDALGVLRARALFDCPERPVYVRIAGLGGAIYLDLGDAEWRAIEITPGAWRVISDPPVQFRRPRGLLALPEPTRGGSLDALRPFVNVHDADWRLLLSWLVAALRDRGPYVILLLYGQQGTAKSTTMRVLRALVDPNRSPIRSKPRDEDALLIAARSGAIVAIDNVSYLSDEMSDALCRLATGGGIGKRQLYTDADEVLLDATRAVMLNGIEELARRGDLADRGLVLEQPPIPKRRRRDERAFWAEFEAAPAILGALLEAAVVAVAREPEIRLDELPRMADFAVWSAAAAPALGWTAEAFLTAYENNRRDRDQAVLDDSPVSKFLVDLAEEHGEWIGTASELLAELRDRADDRSLKDRRWPKDATRLSGMLRRLTPSLHAGGVGVEPFRDDDKNRTRKIRLWRLPDPVDPGPGMKYEQRGESASVASVASAPSDDQIGDVAGSTDATASTQRPQEVGSASATWADHAADADLDAVRTLRNGHSVRTPPDRADATDATDAVNRSFSHLDAVSVLGAEDTRRVVAELARLPVVGLDIETTGLDPRSHRIRLVQLAAPDGRVYLLDLFRLEPRFLVPLLDPTVGPVLTGHNLKFDLGFLAEAGLPVPDGARLFDTMIGAHLLEDGANRFPAGHFGLAGVADRYLGVTLDKSLQVSDWSGPLSDEQIAYAARDAAVLPRLHAVMRERLRGEDLERVAALEMRALPAVVWLERTGAPFDQDAWVTLAEQATRRQVELEQALTEMSDTLGPADIFGESVPTVNWSSPAQVQQVLAGRGHTVERVDEDTLIGLAEVEPLARLLIEHREAAKRAGTYGIEFLKHVHPTMGRIHADWKQLGSRAGRMSCSKPNLQQVPRTPAYRACFRPAEGRVLVKADYSQIELRIAAEITADARLLAAYAAGEDVHTLTAGEVLGRRNGDVTKEARQAAKAINFGLMYGCGGPTLRRTAKRDYGVELSEAEAVQFRRRFFDTYPGLKSWHWRQPGQERAIDTRTLAGRRRLGVTSFTEQINTPIQGTGADGLKAALALLWETRGRCPGAAPVLVVHDEIVLECDVADVEQAREWLTDCMTRGMASFLARVPVVVETAIERDWSGAPISPTAEVGAS